MTTNQPGGNIILTISDANTTTGGQVGLKEISSSNQINLKAPNSLASNITFTLPSSTGNTNQILQTNGSGVLSFVDPPSGVSGGSSITTGGVSIYAGLSAGNLQFRSLAAGSSLMTVTQNTNDISITFNESNLAQDVLTTTGDLMSHNGSSYIRVPAGTNNYVLGSTGSAIQWQEFTQAVSSGVILGADSNQDSSASGGAGFTIHDAFGVGPNIEVGPDIGYLTIPNNRAIQWNGPTITNYYIHFNIGGLPMRVNASGVGETITYQLITATNATLTTGVTVLASRTAIIQNVNDEIDASIGWAGPPTSSTHIYFGFRFSITGVGSTVQVDNIAGSLAGSVYSFHVFPLV